MKMFLSRSVGMCVAAALVVASGCQKSSDVASVGDTDAGAPQSAYIVDLEPTGAMPVGEAREKSEDGQEVTLVGLIGGSSEPFVDGLAAFTIVDPKVPYCAADEGCPTPWDYCCHTDQVADNIATIKIVDESGSPVAQDARELLGVKELSTVVIKGKAKRDDQGNLSVATSEVFVRPGA
ncbi:hypothetical protein [Allorhodopirellula heiligendammensis]|uniref:Uncharacterized protein n=1 Tax=Allorhodopirellula heiligendammensis TaxID=2714739 RepID=A0A5C6C5I3_9BACT|nr:hypothetical protein [Allorhodopirellula heiligendammensis]TWU18821.1 hypothetical protein Poly21_09870 [Allorhodopirellula heiligendammensis]